MTDTRHHPTLETLERYALHHLAGNELDLLEEHLILCNSCQVSLAEIDEYIAVMKAAVAEISSRKELGAVKSRHPTPEATSRRFPNLRPTIWRPTIWAGAAAMLFLAVGPTLPLASPVEPIPVTLSSVRSVDPDQLAKARAHVPLLLTIQAPDVSQSSGCYLEIVDSTGNPVWNGALATDKHGSLISALDSRLRAGSYWVRLYRGDGLFLREFSLLLV